MLDTALVVIDVQQGLFSDESYPVYDGDALLTRLGSVIEKAHEANIPVIYVQHCGGKESDPLYPANPGHAIHPRITPKDGDLVVKKTHPDAFQDTALQALLEAQGIKKLIIGGLETPMCVDTTIRSAYRLGYEVTLISDGHSSAIYGTLNGPQMIAHHNEALGSWFCAVKPAAEIMFQKAEVTSSFLGGSKGVL